MPLTRDFKHHLHALRLEVSLTAREESEEYKRQAVWEAQQTHNQAAIPLAYKTAALHAFRTRVELTVGKYMDALAACGILVDDDIESEMLNEISSLTSIPGALSFPPAVKGQQATEVRQSYGQEAMRLGNQMYKKAANKLRQAKLSLQRVPAISSTTILNIYQTPESQAHIYNNSVIHTTQSTELSIENLRAIEHLSCGVIQLNSTLVELRESNPHKKTLSERLQNWWSVAKTVDNIYEAVHSHYPQLESLIRSLEHKLH